MIDVSIVDGIICRSLGHASHGASLRRFNFIIVHGVKVDVACQMVTFLLAVIISLLHTYKIASVNVHILEQKKCRPIQQ